MRAALRLVVLVLLALATWKVYAVRAELATGDVDPAVAARMSAALSRVPRSLEGGRWVGRDVAIPETTVRMSGADTHASIEYAGPGGSTVQLYVGGSIRNQENFHAPSRCMPAAGWEVIEERTVPLPFATPTGGEARARRLRLQRGTEHMVVHYWFQAGDRIADHEWTIRWLRLQDLLAGRHLRPTVIVIVYAPVRGDTERTESEAREFIAVLGPLMNDLIRGEE